MSRSVIVYAVVLTASLVWAYMTWTHEGEPDPDEVVVILDGKPENLVSVVYDSDKLDVTVTMKTDDFGRYGWAEVTPKLTEPAAPEPEPEGPHAKPVPDTKATAFKVGKAGDKLLAAMAPFAAKRRLEGVSDDQLGELGLDPPEATLTITREGREPKSYELGGNAFGGVNVYVRDPSDGKLYLLDAKTIAPLKAAKRTLLDRTLYAGAVKDIKSVQVSDGSRSVSFVHKNPDDADARFWARDGETSADATADAWLGKALTLSASAYVPADETPPELVTVFSMTLDATGQRKPVTVQIKRGLDDEGEESFFATSDHTRGLVRLHRSLAAEASADLESAFGGEAE